jgi:four helix bundle protein
VEDLIRGSLAAFRSFEDIEAWQKARELARTIYLVSNSGEFSRDFALRDQIRRAVISIVSNIAEGFERDGNAEFIQLLSVAKGSAGELTAQLYAALDCGYINSEKFNKLCALASEVSAKLSRLMAYLRNSGMKGKKFK